MNTRIRKIPVLLGLLLLPCAGSQAAPYTLTNGVTDANVTVGVDGYGSFGSFVGVHATDASYNPVGAGTAAGTTFESGVAIGFGSAGPRSFLSTGLDSGLANPAVSGTPLSGSSSFAFGGLSFALTQTLTPLFSGAVRTGSLLTQRYRITNTASTSGAPVTFELVRYIDGDLLFNGSLVDGGGRLAGSPEILFELDSATGAATGTTFLGITAEGGSSAGPGRYEVDSFSGLRSRIIAGTALDELIFRDTNADQFIDIGYDVTLALRNSFSLAPGGETDYTTLTIWGTGAPGEVVVTPPCGVPGTPDCTRLPEPGSLALLGLALAGLGFARRLVRKA